MADWEVWRQDDNGHRFKVGTLPDRVDALATVLRFEAGYPHKQMYEVVGGRGPAVRTNRDLYRRLVTLGEQITASGRALLDYLCALWPVSRPLAVHEQVDGDLLVAMLTAAGTAPPVRPDPAWRVADLTVDGAYVGFADFTRVLCTQITDLLAFEEQPPGPYAALGVDAPPRLDGGRATVERWCNFDPARYLECAVAGSVGGWSVEDGHRVRAEPADGADPSEMITPLPALSWGDVAAFLEYGQSYE
jgi:hypothetical protein